MDQLLEVGAAETARIISDYGVVWDICHFAIALMGVKKKLGTTARESPLISAGVSMFGCFLSGFSVNLLCGFPLLGSLQSTSTLGLIFVLWLLMNFIIPDTFDTIFNLPPVLMFLLAGKELIRNKKIFSSIDKALTVYPDSLHLVALLGLTGTAAGGAVTHYLAAAQNKSFSGNQRPALATKFCVMFAVIHACSTMGIPIMNWLPTRAEVSFIQFSIMTPVIIAEKFGIPLDPFQPIQAALYHVFIGMGGEDSPSGGSSREYSKKSKKNR